MSEDHQSRINRSTIEMLEEDGQYTMKVMDSYMDPDKAREMARKTLDVIEDSDWDE